MKTFSNDIDHIPQTRLWVLRRWVRNSPFGYSTRMALFRLVDKLLRWINLTFYNLPKKYPEDFAFDRCSSFTSNGYKKQKETNIYIKGNLVIRTEREKHRDPSISDPKDRFRIVHEQTFEYPISENEKRSLYALLRKVGFLHFEHENVEVSFDAHGSTFYALKANGIEYLFNDSTESPLDPFWRPASEALDMLLYDLAKIEIPKPSPENIVS